MPASFPRCLKLTRQGTGLNFSRSVYCNGGSGIPCCVMLGQPPRCDAAATPAVASVACLAWNTIYAVSARHLVRNAGQGCWYLDDPCRPSWFALSQVKTVCARADLAPDCPCAVLHVIAECNRHGGRFWVGEAEWGRPFSPIKVAGKNHILAVTEFLPRHPQPSMAVRGCSRSKTGFR